MRHALKLQDGIESEAEPGTHLVVLHLESFLVDYRAEFIPTMAPAILKMIAPFTIRHTHQSLGPDGLPLTDIQDAQVEVVQIRPPPKLMSLWKACAEPICCFGKWFCGMDRRCLVLRTSLSTPRGSLIPTRSPRQHFTVYPKTWAVG